VGHLNPYKLVPATLRAFKALLMEAPRSLYLLVGSRSPNYDPTRQIEMLGLSGKVKSTGYASPQDFAYYLAASDVCLNLRYPTAGETSASLLRIMGAGVPVLVSRTGAFEELPDDAVGKVDVDETEEDLLLEYLLALAKRPELRAAMARAARSYVAERHTLEAEARGYLAFLAQESGAGSRESVELSAQALNLLSKTYESEEMSTKATRLTTQNSKLKTQNSDQSPVSIVAQAAAELGVKEDDEAVL